LFKRPDSAYAENPAMVQLQAACFARLAGSDAAMVRITLSLAEKALQLQPDNPHYVSETAVSATASHFTSLLVITLTQHCRYTAM
jgi:hypothetical protein